MTETDYIYYGSYAPVLEKTADRIEREVDCIIKSMEESNGSYSPAEHVLSRIKSAKSIQEKMSRHGFPAADAKLALSQMHDVIGVRVVTHFVGDVYAILDRIKESGAWNVELVKDYISMPKENGYRSLHVILLVETGHALLPAVRAEIQLRTIAMDCWASLEHEMKYKKRIENQELIVEELKRCADEIASTDLSMQTLKELISQT